MCSSAWSPDGPRPTSSSGWPPFMPERRDDRGDPGPEEPMYQLHAIKYAELNARKRGDLFVGGDPHDGRIDMDYFVWVAIGADLVCVVDTGFSAEVGARRGRRFLRSPVETLADLGVNAAS